MLSRNKVEEHCTEALDDETIHPEVQRFIKDFLILIEFGQMDPDDDEETGELYE